MYKIAEQTNTIDSYRETSSLVKGMSEVLLHDSSALTKENVCEQENTNSEVIQFSGVVDTQERWDMPSLHNASVRSVQMPKPIQAKMENAFNADFSSVNYVESPAVSSVGASAFAQGNTVGFAPGKFSPNTVSGQELIGHELSHVVSQVKGEVSAPQGKGLPFVADRGLENRADIEGVKAARGETVNPNRSHISVTPMSMGTAPVQGKLPWKSKNSKDTKGLSEEERETIRNKFGAQKLKDVVAKRQLEGEHLDKMTNGVANHVIKGMDSYRKDEKKHKANKKNQAGTSLHKYVETMDTEAANWMGTQLDAEELMTVLDYTDSTYTKYNGVLRGMPGYLQPEIDEYQEKSVVLNRALGKYHSNQEMTVYRGISSFESFNFLIQDAGLRVPDANSKSTEELVDIYNSTLPGQLLLEKGFLSTSVNRDRAEDFSGGAIVMQIHLPRGVKGAPIMNFSAYQHENEFLLASGQLLEFKRAERGHGRERILLHLEALTGITEEGARQS